MSVLVAHANAMPSKKVTERIRNLAIVEYSEGVADGMRHIFFRKENERNSHVTYFVDLSLHFNTINSIWLNFQFRKTTSKNNLNMEKWLVGPSRFGALGGVYMSYAKSLGAPPRSTDARAGSELSDLELYGLYVHG